MMIGRRTLALAALIGLSGSLPALGQDATARARLADQLLKSETESWGWMKNGNVAAMRDYLADDALLIFGDGTRFTKAEFLKAITTSKLTSLAIEKGHDAILIAPDVATLLYRVTYTTATGTEKPVTTKVASSSTYVRRNGRWLSVLYQETPVK
ncbi:MAG: nuclear transport factor 2 family protein [Alphaproteobacteria bacterium]|nr:nuclear transport factor 2 family protein [Alphaproteobacteria bacterium]